MQPQVKAKLMTAIGNAVRDAEDCAMEDIQYVIDIVSKDPGAWQLVQKRYPELKLPTFDQCANAAINQLRSAIWPEKIQRSVLSAGISEEEDGANGDLDDSLDEDWTPSNPNADEVKETDKAVPSVSMSAGVAEAKPKKQYEAPDSLLLNPTSIATPPPSGQTIDVSSASPASLDVAGIDMTGIELPGLELAKRKFGSGTAFKRKLAEAKEKDDSDVSGSEKKKQHRRKNKSEDEEMTDLDFRITTLEHEETTLRAQCKNALKIFSPFEDEKQKPWLKKPPKADGPRVLEDRVGYIEGRFEAFDRFILRDVLVQETEVVQFDSAASTLQRLDVLEKKSADLERILRKQIQAAEASWYKPPTKGKKI